MRYFKVILILLILIPSKASALIEVDITRGNLNPLPIAVSPLSLDANSKTEFKKIKIKNFFIKYITLLASLLHQNLIVILSIFHNQ